MMVLALLFAFFAIFAVVLGFMPIDWDNRPKLNLSEELGNVGMEPRPGTENQNKGLAGAFKGFLSRVSFFNKPLASSDIGRRVYRDLGTAKSSVGVEEFFLLKQLSVIVLLFLSFTLNKNPELTIFYVLMSVAVGYYLPEIWLKARVSKIKEAILRDLPDTVDLLGLCVNAGLDFMMALKYVIEKSAPSVITEELRIMMQEINVGKPRRDALRDMARKYEMPDLSTFSRTLIQADRMGTSVSEALNILSEDMRETRFRRGEAMALKAPLKMLIPLLFFIFPVVAILVAGPVFLDFFQNNPLQNLGK